MTNLSSVNPTRVNGEVLLQSERLKHGDVITIFDRSFRSVWQKINKVGAIDVLLIVYRLFITMNNSNINETQVLCIFNLKSRDAIFPALTVFFLHFGLHHFRFEYPPHTPKKRSSTGGKVICYPHIC